MLLTKSTDGGATFNNPVKINDYYDLPNYQSNQSDDTGRACVPKKNPSTQSVFQTANYPSGAVNPHHPNVVTVTFNSYINRYSKKSNNCTPTGFNAFKTNTYTDIKTTKTCNNNILINVSNNNNTNFTNTTTNPQSLKSVTNDPNQRTTDQFWQWNTYTQAGKLAMNYFDQQYDTDKFNGSSNISISNS